MSETGLHGYVELARKVKFLGGNGSGAVSSTICSDEMVQRDSATSAGEDEANEDGYERTGPIPSQGRSMLRRRRQFDAQGKNTSWKNCDYQEAYNNRVIMIQL